jgi:uncharacterized protein YrrD
MTSFREVRGERVVSSDDAQQLGKLAHLVVDPSTQRLTDVAIEGGKQLVPWADVVAFGPDAIMVSSATGVHEPTDDRAKHDLLDRLILSDQGNDCGTVHDVEFNPETGELLAILTEQGRVEPDRMLTIGHYAVIIATRPDTEVSGQ